MSTFGPIVAAREELATRRFRSTNEIAVKYNKDSLRRTRDWSQFGDAGKKREAAELWLDYIAEGMSPDEAAAELRQNRSQLNFSANDVATGIWHARDCLRLGYARVGVRPNLQLLLPEEALREVAKVLDLRPSNASPLTKWSDPDYTGRGLWANHTTDGVVVYINEDDPRCPRVKELAAA